MSHNKAQLFMFSVPASKVYHTKLLMKQGWQQVFTATNNMKLFYTNEDTPTHLAYQLIHHKT